MIHLTQTSPATYTKADMTSPIAMARPLDAPLRASEDDSRWAALMERDPESDGRFVYAVTTTGIFCRPTCPSRRPSRDRVRFFDSPALARQAGYRACTRCRPDAPFPDRARTRAIDSACRTIADAETMPLLTDLAQSAGMSVSHFHRVFRKTVGVTPRQFRHHAITERAKRALRNGESVTGALYEAGFSSSGRFYETGAPRMGMPPGHLRAGGRNESIRFAVTGCRLGLLLVAATNRGVCEVWLGDNPASLVRRLKASYPNAAIAAADPQMKDFITQIVTLIDKPTSHISLPLDLRGTAFQMRVWEALRHIPPGETRTYAQLAAAIGRPTAARAVGQACAKNPAAIVIPCHRAVGRGGAMRGYRWGVGRKRALLEGEGRDSEGRRAASAAQNRARRTACEHLPEALTK